MAVAQELAATVTAAVEKQDAAEWAKVVSRDVVILPAGNPMTPGAVVHGQADAEKLFQGMFQSGVKHVSIKVLEAHLIGRSAIWAVGEIHFTGTRPIDARYGQVLVHSRAGWKARMMTVSGDLPPGMPPGGMPPGAPPK